MRILVAVDGSKDCLVALEHAVKVALSGDYEKGYHRIYLVNVCREEEQQHNKLTQLFSHSSKEEKSEKEKLHEARAIIDDVIKRNHELENIWHQEIPLIGDPGEKLLECALEHKCKIIFCGKKGMTKHQNLATKLLGSKFGSISEFLIENAPHGMKVHVGEFGSAIVDVYPKTAVTEKEQEKMIKRATKAGVSFPELVVQTFVNFDSDHSNCLDVSERTMLLQGLGVDENDERVQNLLEATDADRSGTLEFNEFCDLINHFERIDLDIKDGLAKHGQKLKSRSKQALEVPGKAVRKGRRLSQDITNALRRKSSPGLSQQAENEDVNQSLEKAMSMK